MARNFNGFILAQDKKPPAASKKTTSVKTTANGKPKTLLQENLSLVKAETKKIYGGASTVKPKTVPKKPLKATKEVNNPKNGGTSTTTEKKITTTTQRTAHEMSDGKPNHIRSNSRTLEPHEIVLLKNPKYTEEPGVDTIQHEIPSPDKDSESYESDFEEYESDFSEESNETNGTTESEKKVSEIEHFNDEDDDDESMSENFTTAIEVKPVLHVQRKSRLYDRSYEIMRKITLDHMSYELFDANPVPYQTFMKLYGNSQSMQNFTQTDTFTKSIETQTNIYKKFSVWTQFPIEIATQVESMSEMETKEENEEESAWMEKTLKNLSTKTNSSNVIDYAFDMDKLNAFLTKYLATISSILDRNTKTKQLKQTELEISKGYNEIDISNLNRGSNVSLIYANPDVPNTLLTVHTSKTLDSFTQECLVCIWNTAFSEPLKILSCWNWISCLLIVPTMKTVIVGGSKDGVIVCWDTLERVQWNRAFPLNFHNAPSVVTTSTDTNGSSYNGEILAMRLLPMTPFTENFNTNQTAKLCTLHEEGVITEWSLMYMQSLGNESLIKAKLDQGAMWSKLKLIQTNIIQVLALPPFSQQEPEAKIDTDLEKTYKYFEAGIYNDKVLQNLSEANAAKVKHHLLSLSERVIDLLVVDNEHLAVLTNKNYLYTCSLAEYSKMRKLMIEIDDANDAAYGITMCSCTEKSVVGVVLSNGIVKFVNISPEIASETNFNGNYEDPLISYSRYNNISCGFHNEQLFVVTNNKLTIYENGCEKIISLTDDVKSFQFVNGIDGDTKLVMLLQNGTVIIHFLKN
ncbi:uncharacterized protein LOC134833473 [Culicoides brevitarsis]|uniref:uncharacterized protein LOC134833473 n=1 Tax=Culicoides brevitarsis TaxID=469753 RepID=UPI00307BFA58